MNLLLSEPLPLRTTKALGDFAEDTVLPHVIGDLSSAPFPLIRLDDDRFFVADHPMVVEKVFVDRQAVQDWAVKFESDDAGHTWTEVLFAAPVPQTVKVSATGTGVLNADTGDMIENPGDVAAYIDALAGRDMDWSRLRAECSGLALTVAGRLATVASIRAHQDAHLQSAGIIWCQGMARVYPSSADPSPVLDLAFEEVTDLEVSASLEDTADVLRLSYDRSDASARAQHYIELTASPQRFGGIAKEVAYPWLRSPANAELVGRAVLSRLAGERYAVEFDSDDRSLRAGTWVRLVAHPEWPLPGDDPVIMILAVELKPDENTVHVTGETIIGESLITVTAHSLALPDTVEASIEVSVRDGVATFTITDEDGRPVAGARVALDGGQPKTTDAQGKVQFPAVEGPHELAVSAPGFDPFTIEVTL